MAAAAGLSLLNLENKTRQQPKIAHEQGAGSQCTKCGPKCPGMDLHFWRKICRNCRCGKEMHNVTDEDPSLRLIHLLNPSSEGRKEELCKLNLTAGPSSPMDWVPPASDFQLALKHMEQLPLAKQAAADRKIALDRQLPLHDLDPEQCSNLSANEKIKMENYVKNVRQHVVGQGLIQECPPGKLPPPPPKLGRILEEKVSHLNLNDSAKRPIASLVTAKPFVKAPSVEQRNTKRNACDPFDDLPPPPPPDMLVMDTIVVTPETPPPPPPPVDATSIKRPQDPVREFFDFLDEQEGKKLPGKLKSPFLHQETNARPSPGTSPNLNQRNQLKVETGSGGSSPRLERGNDNRRLLTTDFDYSPQLSKSDSNSNQIVPQQNNNNPSPLSNRRPSAPCGQDNNKYVTGQQPEVVDEGGSWCCRKCSQPIEAGTVAIFAERAGSDKCWHPQCFVCSICHEMLADLIYFYVDDDVFCGRHYAEKMKIPRCKACDELIFAPEYTSAEDATWHMDHFCCWLCDTPLAGHQYTPIDGQPHCLDCYQKKYGKDCYECHKPIRADETRVSHGEMNWHNGASCFKCRHCQVSMMNRQFILKNGQIYCSRQCVVEYAQCQAQPVLV